MADRAGPDVVRQLLAMLDDEPRWIDVRGMLLGGHAQVTGGGEQVARARDGSGWVVKVLHGAVSVIGVVGRPSREVLAEVVRDVTELTPIVVQTVDASWVAGCLASHDTSSPVWRAERVIAHRLGPAARGAALEGREGRGDVRLLTAADSLAHLPPGLRHELTHARSFAPVAALFEAAMPVSFCYPVWRTESLWDVSIDTLDGYRGRGFAMHAVRYLIEHMRREGREPVWCALESNTASLRLAAKLGFERVDAFVVFSRGAWVILAGGFEG